MRRLFAVVGVCGLAIGVALGGSDSTPATPKAPTMTELVAQLGSEQFHEREAAVKALEKSGSAALPALREGAKSSDPEVRQRAAAILVKLQRAADSAGRLNAKKVTLNYRDVPLGTAVNDLKTRTGLNLTVDPARIADPLRKVTCVSGELPVWEALEVFCAAAGLKEAFRADLDLPKQQPQGRRGYAPPPTPPNPDAVPIVLIDGKAQRLPGSYNTAVRVVALPASFPGHRVRLGTGDTTFCFDITPAPGLNWQDVVAVKITRLTDDAGRPGGAGSIQEPLNVFSDFDGIVAWGGGGFGGRNFGFIGGGGGMMFDPVTGNPILPSSMPNPRVVPVPLKLGTPTARGIKRLEGVVLGELQLTNQTLITVLDPAKNTGTAFDGPGQVRVTVQAASDPKGDSDGSMQVLLEYPSPYINRRGLNAGLMWMDNPRGNVQQPTVQVRDANDKPIPTRSGSGFTNGSDDGMTYFQTMNLTFRKEVGMPAKLVVVGPRPLVVEVPFVMENVPLP